MAYLIDGASGVNDGKKSFLIRGGKIAYMADHLDRLKHMEVNCDGFLITPGRIIIDFSIMHIADDKLYKKRFIKLQRQGCTTVVIICPVPDEKQLKQQLKRARHHMINSSIDYVIGVSFPLRKITPSFVRTCRRERIPVMIATLNDESDIDAVSWPWIRDELFLYRMTIIPNWQSLQMSNRKQLGIAQKWQQLALTNDIPTLSQSFDEGEILTRKALRKTGISPLKGELRIGSDLDYNLYRADSLADGSYLYYDELKVPDIVVAKGTMMKAGSSITFRPGFGKEISVKMPGYFASY